ncbi:MAG: UDP-GlcNAc--UDP-phosphate GlcNAc-1-phosphate transferase, partial [Ginsengibacter sp.]
MTFAIYLAIFFFLIITYIRIAQRLQIADTPNQRSSHTAVTVRGAGIIFPFGLIFPAIFLSKYNHQALFLAGLLLISAISFIDDLRTLNSKWR